MESINVFSKGMDLDMNPLNLEKGKYREASNIRLVNDIGATSFSVNNVKGNLFDQALPTTPIFQKIEIIGDTLGAVQSLTINGETGTSFSTVGMTPEDLYNYITSDPLYTLNGVQYNLYYGNSYLVIVPINVFTLTISTNDPTKLSIDSNYIPSQSNLEIIGSVDIRGVMYLFSTNNTSKNPGGHDTNNLTVDASSVGQIWKYTYDKITLAGTLTLIYNNYVDFSTYWCIAPTAVTGRYENSNIQRIYWTDNFNKLRSLNVSDPNSLAIDVSILDIRPAIDMDRPIMTDIGSSSGSIILGAYQCAYRFKNNGGATTNFSELSDLVYIVPTVDEHAAIGGANFKNYIGGGIGSVVAKQITWTISNLDPDFDRIEVAVLFRETPTDPPTIFIIKDEEINRDEFVVTYDGTQDETPMTLEEFLILSSAFTHCKTIGTKDNRLFVGNTRNLQSDIDYDARAYRYPSGSTTTTLTNNGVTAVYSQATLENTTVPFDEESDAINSDPTLNKYKPGTSILGGTGINISYEFYTQAIPADIDPTATNTFNVPDLVFAPWRHTNPDYNQTELNLGVKSFSDNFTQVDQTIPTAFPNNINAGFKYPPYTSALRGFQRDETYRFGIQFFDKTKNPSFVKWIGDIKMPDFFDTNPNAFFSNGDPAVDVANNPITDFRLSFTGSHVPGSAYNEAYVQTLGILFTVNIPASLSSQIDGYSIVRVKREEEDRTIVSQGYITLAEYGSDGNIYTTSPSNDPSGNTAGGVGIADRGFYITPDLIDPNITVPSPSMSMTVKAVLSNINTDATVLAIGGGTPYYYYKYYNQLAPSLAANYTFNQIDYIGYAGDITDNTTNVQVNNFDWDSISGISSQGYSIGNAAYFFKTVANIDYGDLALLAPAGKLLVNIQRTVADQYGGNTFSDRSKNTYISCSHYRPIRNSSTDITDTFQLFGGDIFVNMYDSCRWAKNWGSTNRGLAPFKYSTTFYFPVESTANADLRSGVYMNKDFSVIYDSPGQELQETYTYNPVYGAQCDVKSFFPKPEPFTINEEFDNRFYASEIKVNGELSDSWGVFKTNNYWDVEGTYGPINAMSILSDRMYFWQNRAFGTLQINPRTIVTDNNNNSANNQLQLGTGLPLQRHDYLSTEIGLQHQWGITKSSTRLYWLDVANKKFFTYSQGPITPQSDVKGLFSYLSNNLRYNVLNVDKPTYFDSTIGINGVRAVYDFKYNQAIFTIHDGRNVGEGQTNTIPFTIAYDDRIDAFSTFYSFVPRVYFTDGYKMFSTNPTSLSDIYIHDSGDYSSFYGIIYSTALKLVVNDNAQYTKVFDNIMYDSQVIDPLTSINYNDDTWNIIRVYNTYQNTDYQTLMYNSNIKRKERTWQLAIPRNRVLYTSSNSPDIFTDLSPTDKVMGERMRDKYIITDLVYNNLNNRNLAMNNFRTIYRTSAR